MPFMFRVTSLTKMPEAQLNRWIKRIGLLLFVGIVAFVAFYAVDRFRAATAADRRPGARRPRGGRPGRSGGHRRRAASSPTCTSPRAATRTRSPSTPRSSRPARRTSSRASAAARPTELRASCDAAIADYQKVVEIGHDRRDGQRRPDARRPPTTGSARSRSQQDEPDDAVEQLAKALAIKRTDADALYLLGDGLRRDRRQPDKAMRAPAPGGRLRAHRLGRAVPGARPTPTRQAGEAELAEWAGAMAACDDRHTAAAESRLLTIVTDGAAGLDAAIGLGLLDETTRRHRGRRGVVPQGPRASTPEQRDRQARPGPGRPAPEGTASIAPSPSAGGEQLMTASLRRPAECRHARRPRRPTASRPTARPPTPRGTAGRSGAASCSSSCCCCSASRCCSGLAIWYLLFRQPIPHPDDPGRDRDARLLDLGLRRRPADGRRRQRRRRPHLRRRRPRATGSRGSSTPAATELGTLLPPDLDRRRARAGLPGGRPARRRGLRHATGRRASIYIYDAEGTYQRDVHAAGRASPAGSRWASRSTRPATCTSPTVGHAPEGRSRVRSAPASWSATLGETDGLNFPNGVAVDGAGNVYVTDSNNGRLLVFAQDGQRRRPGRPRRRPGQPRPARAGMAIDGQGRVYVVDATRPGRVRLSRTWQGDDAASSTSASSAAQGVANGPVRRTPTASRSTGAVACTWPTPATTACRSGATEQLLAEGR